MIFNTWREWADEHITLTLIVFLFGLGFILFSFSYHNNHSISQEEVHKDLTTTLSDDFRSDTVGKLTTFEIKIKALESQIEKIKQDNTEVNVPVYVFDDKNKRHKVDSHYVYNDYDLYEYDVAKLRPQNIVCKNKDGKTVINETNLKYGALFYDGHIATIKNGKEMTIKIYGDIICTRIKL